MSDVERTMFLINFRAWLSAYAPRRYSEEMTDDEVIALAGELIDAVVKALQPALDQIRAFAAGAQKMLSAPEFEQALWDVQAALNGDDG